MKITKEQLKQIIKEEADDIIDEGIFDFFKNKSGEEKITTTVDRETLKKQHMAEIRKLVMDKMNSRIQKDGRSQLIWHPSQMKDFLIGLAQGKTGFEMELQNEDTI